MFSVSPEIGGTLCNTTNRVMDYLGAEAISIFLLDEVDGSAVCESCAGPVDITGLRIGRGRGIVGKTLETNLPQMVLDVSQSEEFANHVDEETGFRTRSILCAPLHMNGETFGAIEVINKQSDDGLFVEADLDILQVMATLAALAINNARMASDLIEKHLLQKDLETARNIQCGMLPSGDDQDSPIQGLNLSAKEVSGDFYSYFPLQNGNLAFCVGDITGKGMDAALLMSRTISLFRCLAKSYPDPGDLLSALNNELLENPIPGKFVTMVSGVFYPGLGLVEFSNGGHNPLLFRAPDGSFTEFYAKKPLLGAKAGLVYETERLPLAGGTLYVYTDGITEGTSEDGSEIGVDGLMRLCNQFAFQPLHQRIRSIVGPLADHGKKLFDDITLLVIEETTTCKNNSQSQSGL